MGKVIWSFNNIELEKKIVGPVNTNLTIIGTDLGYKIEHTNNYLMIDDDLDEAKLVCLLEILDILYKDDINFGLREMIHILMLIKSSTNLSIVKEEIVSFYHNKLLVLNTFDSKRIYCKTLMQKNYIELVNSNSIVFATGPAGTGKTYLAVAYAVSELKKNNISKIIITRPAVEAGEKLGFLPGDLKEKVDPYLIPIYDALNEFLGKQNVEKLIEKGVLEVAPLAYMRGRTLDHAVIILDEAQNTTKNQIKMFLTRLGFDSKMIITGDNTQIDLVNKSESGLVCATSILDDIDGISIIHFSKYDVMRHPLVTKIVERFEERDK